MEDRIKALKAIMETHDTDGMILIPSAKFLYFAGYMPFQDERPFFLLLPKEGKPSFVLPKLQVPELLNHIPDAVYLEWEDGEDAYAVYSRAMRESGLAGSTVGVDPGLTAHILLSMMQYVPCQYVTGENVLGETRLIKYPEELEALRLASCLADEVMETLYLTVREGMTESEVADRIQDEFASRGSRRLSFDPIVASGPNSAFPHHSPGQRKLEPGDALVLDFGAYVGDYPSDVTRTFVIGNASRHMTEVYKVVKKAQEAAFRKAGPGVPAEEVDRAARTVIEAAGYGEFFLHRTGHGVGLEIHEMPSIVAGNAEPLREGMVFSIEPGIYLPGEFGVRIEDLVEITPHGARRLNAFRRELASIG